MKDLKNADIGCFVQGYRVDKALIDTVFIDLGWIRNEAIAYYLGICLKVMNKITIGFSSLYRKPDTLCYQRDGMWQETKNSCFAADVLRN